MKTTAPFGFRYQYLAGGVNTGQGWATWNSSGAFVTYYIQDSVANGITPVFTYYQLRQSAPNSGESDGSADYDNLQNTATMTAYYQDLTLFFQRAGAFPSARVVLHVEPDFWGFMEQRASNNDASTVPAQVASTGITDIAGLPNTVAGFAQAVVLLRNKYAPNVSLGYHLSIWGTGTDILLSKPDNATVQNLATTAGTFANSLHASFDVAFAEFLDRDSAFYQYQYGDGGARWYQPADYDRHVLFLSTFASVAGKRLVLWQIPYGNTKMDAENNTWDHYQSNQVETLIGDPLRTYLTQYANAGVLALLFGGGASGVTCACDADSDGVVDYAPINGNTGKSLSADDDGGYFRRQAALYYSGVAMGLPGGSTSSSPSPSPSPSPSTTPSPSPSPSFSIGASPTSIMIRPHQSGSATVKVTSVGSFNTPVALSLSGLPQGATGSWSNGTVTPSASGVTSTLTVHAGATQGTSTLTITGSGGGITRTTTITLVIAK